MKTRRGRDNRLLHIGDHVHVVDGSNRGRHGIIDGFTPTDFVRLTWTFPKKYSDQTGRSKMQFCIKSLPPQTLPRRATTTAEFATVLENSDFVDLLVDAVQFEYSERGCRSEQLACSVRAAVKYLMTDFATQYDSA